MNFKIRLSEYFEGKYLLLQTFAFLCGSLLTLIYLPHKSVTLGALSAALIYAAVFMLLSACMSSVCASVLLPLLTSLFGAASALISVLICEGRADKTQCIWLGALMAAAVPLHFMFASLGLSFAEKVRNALRKDAVLYRADYILIYCSAFLSASVSVLITVAAVLYIK